MAASDRAEIDKEKAVKKLIMATLCVGIIAGCSAMKPQADGRYFNFGSNNNSEASIWVEKVVVDGKWNAPVTGTLGCGGENINGASGIGSVSYSTPAPQQYIYLEWYSWHEMARMKATIQLPGKDVIHPLLLDPPWAKNKYGLNKSYFIIDFRPENKIWIKLADTAHPKSQGEIMILAEGQGKKTNDIVKDYIHFKEGKDYSLNCLGMRSQRKKLGYYSSNLELFDKWYTEFLDNKEIADE